jgi:hypothetical protein
MKMAQQVSFGIGSDSKPPKDWDRQNQTKRAVRVLRGRLSVLPDLVSRWLYDPLFNRITRYQHLSKVTAPWEYLSFHQPSDCLFANIQQMSHFRNRHECRKDLAHSRCHRPHVTTSTLSLNLLEGITNLRDFVTHSTPLILDAQRQTDRLPQSVLSTTILSGCIGGYC